MSFGRARWRREVEEREAREAIARRDNDPRWKAVTDDTPVTFDGQLCRFGELSQNEKMTVEINERGCLFGGFPC